jgi:hypothetical protein
MLSSGERQLRPVMCKSLRAFACCLLFGVASAQDRITPERQAQLEKRYGFTVRDALAKLKSGEFFGVHLTLIGEVGAVEAIPDLEKQFASIGADKRDPVEQELDKMKIAQVLVRLRDKNDTYWDYLVHELTPVIESDAPSAMSFDREGKSVRHSAPSPEFAAWAKAHNLDPDQEAANAIYLNPGKIMLLAGTEVHEPFRC